MKNTTASAKSGLRDEIEGGAKNIAGKIEEVAGKTIRSTKLENRGVKDQVEGSVQKKVGEVKKVLGG